VPQRRRPPDRDGATVWSATQQIYPMLWTIADLLNPESVVATLKA
jgi:hypothetical protein